MAVLVLSADDHATVRPALHATSAWRATGTLGQEHYSGLSRALCDFDDPQPTTPTPSLSPFRRGAGYLQARQRLSEQGPTWPCILGVYRAYRPESRRAHRDSQAPCPIRQAQVYLDFMRQILSATAPDEFALT
ncbi:hypothetical protein NUW54_g12284 [Trametes sanguinea]|uniref:Uncharacterized protein n=1 Tax=Trametes sanguinea TaxID=158606 RepID=A0ACC1MZB8_9APHY|nr:hypothetical protein NUW54_g12284 [Trametes sanguinea]